jgi:DNA-binding response OmpR family regulator
LSGRPRILVVEDDASLAHLYCTALTMNGLSVMRAADGFSALRVVEEYRPDLVVLDLMLPQIDGWTVLKELESRPSTSGIPVVVVTAAETGLFLPHARVVIQKPADPDHFVRVVSRLLPSPSA